MSISLRIATYNIHKCRGVDRRTDPERIASIIDELDADIVAIQEILDVRTGRSDFDQVRRILAELQTYKSCFGENRTLYSGRYGNMTLSRFPVKLCQNYDVTWRHRERRGCLRTDVAIDHGTVLHIFNVHLGTSFIERRHQARQLLSDQVLARAECTGPTVVAGDFNEWTRGQLSRMMGDAFQVANPWLFLRYGRTYPGLFPILHLDRFYFDQRLSLKHLRLHRSRKSLLASDHLPLVADFEINDLSSISSRR
jgi:endonuclease/exonuclease/phosphatase family metal-dependent hydrolase